MLEPTPQQKIQSRLESCGLPYKEIKVYDSQIMITAWSRTAMGVFGAYFKVGTMGPFIDNEILLEEVYNA